MPLSEIVLRNLDPRLKHLYDWCDNTSYDEVWDLCCDHGRLGLHIKQRSPEQKVHLVDQVPSIIDKLKKQYPEAEQWGLDICLGNAAEIDLAANKKHLIIIAGLGGENLQAILVKILEQLNQLKAQSNASSSQIDFLLSPNSHTYELRAYMRKMKLGCLAEAFIHYKGRYYEHFYLRCELDDHVDKTLATVDKLGMSLWQDRDEHKTAYLEKLSRHYAYLCQREKGSEALAFEAYHAYQFVLNH